MQESTTPFGVARWMMSLSDDKTYGKSSTLYTANGLAWIAVFFTTRIATIPFLLRFGWQDARMLARSATVTRSDRVIFAFLLSTYLAVVPINLFWFGKMVQGALKLLLPRKPKPKPKPKPS